MATAPPVIDSVTPPGPLTLAPGQSVVINVAAHSPNNKSGAATIPVSDSEGNTSQATVTITVNDPLTFGPATTTVGTITQDPTNPTKFTLQV